MITTDSSLLQWERAEIERSSVQAALTARVSTPTPRHIIARYADPPRETPYSLEYAFHLLGDVRGQRVLDLGCGDGEFTTLVAAHGADVTALDISTDLLGLARDRADLDGFTGAVSPLCGSAHSIPVASGSVDVVFGMAVLHHVDLQLAAAEIHRVLKPGGRAIFKEPMRNSRVIAALRAVIPYRQPDISPFERPLRWGEMEAFASRFSSWRHKAFELPFVSLLYVAGAPKTWQTAAYGRDAALLRRSAWLRKYATVMVFEVTK
jgi:ubiquinone/menaquinone biosynthesis C-methylase UbiE